MDRWNPLSLLIIYSRKKQKATLLLVWSRQLKVLTLQNIASQRSHCYCWGKNTRLFCKSTSCSICLVQAGVWSYENEEFRISHLEWEAMTETAEPGFVCWVGGIDTYSWTILLILHICTLPLLLFFMGGGSNIMDYRFPGMTETPSVHCSDTGPCVCWLWWAQQEGGLPVCPA